MVVQFISNLITLNNCPEMSQDHKDFLKKAVKIKKKLILIIRNRQKGAKIMWKTKYIPLFSSLEKHL